MNGGIGNLRLLTIILKRNVETFMRFGLLVYWYVLDKVLDIVELCNA